MVEGGSAELAAKATVILHPRCRTQRALPDSRVAALGMVLFTFIVELSGLDPTTSVTSSGR